MPSLSYQEKSLYGSLAAELVVYVPYFLFHRANSIEGVATMILAIIVVQIVLQSLIAVFTRNRTTDERDRLIELRGYKTGYLTVVSLMVVGLGALWLHTATNTFPLHGQALAMHFLSVFFSVLILGDLAKTVAQIVAYRRAL
ncbi:hypothetical protein SAMN05421819_4340 [Bryocella elongata]|uniref:Uncharacterized protein n=1 Tax=Bryocella elongata TaxID=863522 RepID=A0A1H6CAG5_9BACT|nr:hypothetical protein [Bryocella elongata]SEG69356.1 hypothetical protein SAMN05421819_4340 [Bryocella elongata]